MDNQPVAKKEFFCLSLMGFTSCSCVATCRCLESRVLWLDLWALRVRRRLVHPRRVADVAGVRIPTQSSPQTDHGTQLSERWQTSQHVFSVGTGDRQDRELFSAGARSGWHRSANCGQAGPIRFARTGQGFFPSKGMCFLIVVVRLSF